MISEISCHIEDWCWKISFVITGNDIL